MPTCVRCNKQVSGLGSLIDYNPATKLCRSCEQAAAKALNIFRNAFIVYGQDSLISQEEWNELIKFAKQSQIEWNDALRFVRGDALHLLERTLTFFSADGIITQDEKRYFNELRQYLQLPPDMTRSLDERFNYFSAISDIRQGNLPVVQSSVHLESDEICHLETGAAYNKVRTSSILLVSGRLLATNKKVHFLSQTGGWTIAWKNVMRIDHDARSVYLELSTKKGNGRYNLQDPLWAEAVLTTLTRMAKRQLLAPQTDVESRHIPQDVRLAVWQRDQGKCVQCGATSWLEFDHIIPFSKGGASTVGNVQLLCRRCNLQKGGKI
jgi:5-methylcytosine-specific restriction endonuclease McrA